MKTQLFAGALFGLAALPASALEVRLALEPSDVPRANWPVTSGVPFAQGALLEAAHLTLVDDAGRPVPPQTDILARWPDGSVRWLLVDFQVAQRAPKSARAFTLRHDPTRTATPATSPLRVTTERGLTIIVTGPLRLALDPARLDPLGAAWLDRDGDGRFADDERVTRPAGGFFVRDAAGNRFESAQAPAEIVVEEAGPLRACVRVTGRHGTAGGATLFRYILRLHAIAGQPFVRCSYTFINDAQDAVMTGIKELGLTAQLASPSPAAARRDYQSDESHFERDGHAAGTRAPGWASVGGSGAGLALGVREFWQQWPKSIETREGAIVLGLCPELPAGRYDGKPLREETKLYFALRGGLHTFKAGLAKTHEFTALFTGTDAPADQLASFFVAAEEPLLAAVDPAYAAATRAAGEFPTADPQKYLGYDAWFERAFVDHLRRRDQGREFGLLNWGDWYGEREVNWGNLEYDLQSGLLVQFLRTGDRRYFHRGAQAARHHIEVDVVHATNPHVENPSGPPPKVGEIWVHSVGHTGGYFHNIPELPVDRYYQMGHSANYGHVWATGDLLYYHLTGDRRAREVALEVADMMAANLYGKVDTHIRRLGWPIILVLSAYEATGDPKYLHAATENWKSLRQSLDPQRGWVVRLAADHCLHPAGSTRPERETIYQEQRCEGNVPFMEGLTLSALARYHRHTADPEVLRAITVGIDQMIRECWMEDLKTFRYTACPLSPKTWTSLFMLSAEAIAYEARLTGNREHARILREGMHAAIPRGDGSGDGKGLGLMTFFAPFALSALD